MRHCRGHRQVQLRIGADRVTTYVVDELDRKIIEKLTADARASNRHLAQALGVT
ncbi:MAG: AsnC family protein, partial [Steroidobacteraceae bacterium]